MPTALSRYGVFGRAPQEALDVLALTDEYRATYCALQQDHYEAKVELRNRRFPALYAALVRLEAAKARVYAREREIKQYHSAAGDRNALTPELTEALEAARAERTSATAAVRTQRAAWYKTLLAHDRYWRSLCDWKQVKDRAKRKALYAAVTWPAKREAYAALPAKKALRVELIDPEAVADYGRLVMDFDLKRRDLDAEYQERGLHSAIRAEIVAASQPKKKRDKPGMRYVFGRTPQPKPWRKITLQFPGGLAVQDALAGTPALSITPTDARGVYLVRQQIGTAQRPAKIEYRARLDHPPLPADGVIQRWSLSIERENRLMRNRSGQWREVPWTKCVAVPIFAQARAKPTGRGLLCYDLTWTARKAGIEVATLWGDNVQERVVLPWRLIEDRLCLADERARCDLQANALLASRGCLPPAGKRQGLAALERYVADHPGDADMLEAYRLQRHALLAAKHRAQRAARCIENVYRVVACRVCRLHDRLIEDQLDLSRLKRYDTRDLLRVDKLPRKSREYLFAAAPGKLAALLKGYGLAASTEVPPDKPDHARGTDLFSSYVKNLWHSEDRLAGGLEVARKVPPKPAGRKVIG